MTRDVNKVFNALEHLMMTTALDTASRKGENFAQTVQAKVEAYLKGVFPDLAALIRGGLSAAPDFVESKWAGLDPFYEARKPRTNFALNSDETAATIAGLDPKRIFGSPRANITVQSGGQSFTVFVDSKSRTRYGRGSRDLAGTKIGGRFAALKDFQALKVNLEYIRPAKGEFYGASIDPSWTTARIGQPFTSFEYGRSRRGKQPARPLLVPYLKWKLGPQLAAELRKSYGPMEIVR